MGNGGMREMREQGEMSKPSNHRRFELFHPSTDLWEWGQQPELHALAVQIMLVAPVLVQLVSFSS